MQEEDALLAALKRLAPRLSEAASGVDGLRRLSGGAMQEIWRFDLLAATTRTPLILRRAPAGHEISDHGIAPAGEAAIMQAAAANGVAVPHIWHVLTPEDEIGHGFIMAFVDGETLGGRIVKDARFAAIRPKLARQCGAMLALVHGADCTGLPYLVAHTAETLLAHWRAAYDLCRWPRPVFDASFSWLAANIPPSHGQATLVHGDFRNGNLIIGEDGLRAVLDWELAHLGDGVEDLGWLCVNSWRFGCPEKIVGGFGDVGDLLDGYESHGGRRVERAALRWWQVFGTLRWGVMCAGMVSMFRGADPSVERAVICRRASETEIDLLTMLAA